MGTPKYNNPEYIGKKYNSLTVISISRAENRRGFFWECQCECKKKTVVAPYKVLNGIVKSCGCHKRRWGKSGLSKEEYRRKYHREYNKGYRDLLRKNKLCCDCGKKDAWTMNGHYRCFECNERRRKTPYEPIKKEKDEPIKISKYERAQYGLCYKCGKQVKEGIRPYTGVPYRVCEDCYKNCLAMREAHKEKYGFYSRPYGYYKKMENEEERETNQIQGTSK